jgi:SAM-dependent methyltransferase
MAKIGEINYVRNLHGPEVAHAVHKPFSDAECWRYLQEMGAVFFLLPPPPARLLDMGCGTGWTSRFFARAGYDVVGVDIAPDMIRLADEARRDEGLENLRFAVYDYEELPYEGEFDAVVFYDALHHAVDEALAVAQAYRALVPGGRCLTSEPGEGHADNPLTRAAVHRFGVTEKDMPPGRVVELGRRAGFRTFRAYPHSWDNWLVPFGAPEPPRPARRAGPLKRLFHGLVRRGLRLDRAAYEAMLPWFRLRAGQFVNFERLGGIVCMVK